MHQPRGAAGSRWDRDLTAIDFTRIRSTPKSQNDSFEQLSVQLFQKNCNPPSGSSFISLRGDGGDGGVEAYFRAQAGAVLGVQAKYFFQLGDAEVRQIDKSLKTALANHPSLSEYWVYIPFDLTGRVAEGKRGVSQAERFESWKEKVEREASVGGSKLSVKLCTSSIIRDQLLSADQHGGLQRYWFDDTVLTPPQIRRGLDDAVAFAGPRYTASLDVVTRAHVGLDFFGGTGDFAAWRAQHLQPALSSLRDSRRSVSDALSTLGAEEAARASELLRCCIEGFGDIRDIASLTSNTPPINQLLSELNPLLCKARQAQEDAFFAEHGPNSDTPAFRQFHAEYMCAFPAGKMDASRDLEEQVIALGECLGAPEMRAATASSLLLLGPAGVGKTHSIVSAALRRLEDNGLSIVVFGDDFRGDEPWKVIRTKLGIGSNISRDAVFECLQACADSNQLPFIIYIDALNESPRDARWKKKLPELLSQCAPYPGIKICVSARDTYKNLVVDERFPGYAFEHAGFSGHEFEALQAFAAHYGLHAEITPLFSPEVRNPLFLHLACRTLRDDGKTSLDIAMPGFSALLDTHLKHCDGLVRERLGYSNPRNVVRAAMVRLANALTTNSPNDCTWEGCAAQIEKAFGGTVPAEALLTELQHEGLLIFAGGENDIWSVRLGYQRYGDMLRASSLIEGLDESGKLDVLELRRRLANLDPNDEGLLEALAAVLPERHGIEITDQRLLLDRKTSHRCFVHALSWRSRDSVSAETHKHVLGALRTNGLWQATYDSFFRICLVPEHRLNAEHWLTPFLARSALVDRDAYLSVGASQSYNSDGAVRSLLVASLKADVARWPRESRELAMHALGWLSSCADRRIRDLSAKGLTRLMAFEPGLAEVLVQTFRDCDDDYILESVAQSVYSACLLNRDHRSAFVPALDALLSSVYDCANVLVRDSVRLLGELLRSDLEPSMSAKLDQYPSRQELPKKWPKLGDAAPLIELKGLPTNMKLWGGGLLPDFWRYQVESKIADFDHMSAGITFENIACWFMVEVLSLGYPGHNMCALDADHFITSQYGGGRGRKGYADRVSKKYYWILFHRLLGIFADNVKTKTSSSGWKAGPCHLWSVDVRKADFTDMRDILPLPAYPDEINSRFNFVFPDRASDPRKWVRKDDLPKHEQSLIRVASDGQEWVALSLFVREHDRTQDENVWSTSYLGITIDYSAAFFEGKLPSFVETGAGARAFDSRASWYRAFLAEYPDGPVFLQAEEEGYFSRGPKGVEFAEVGLLRGAEWEYDYSYFGEERQDSLHAPCQQLILDLDLRWDGQVGWKDRNGVLVAFEAADRGIRSLFISRDALNQFLGRSGKSLVYRRVVNRGLYNPSGDDGVQIDIFTFLHYLVDEPPKLLKEFERAFNC